MLHLYFIMIIVCIKCNQKRKHRALNLCYNCYMSVYRKKRIRDGTYLESERDMQKAYFKKSKKQAK